MSDDHLQLSWCGLTAALLPAGVDASVHNLQQRGWPANVHLVGKDILRFHAGTPACLVHPCLILTHTDQLCVCLANVKRHGMPSGFNKAPGNEGAATAEALTLTGPGPGQCH